MFKRQTYCVCSLYIIWVVYFCYWIYQQEYLANWYSSWCVSIKIYDLPLFYLSALCHRWMILLLKIWSKMKTLFLDSSLVVWMTSGTFHWYIYAIKLDQTTLLHLYMTLLLIFSSIKLRLLSWKYKAVRSNVKCTICW